MKAVVAVALSLVAALIGLSVALIAIVVTVFTLNDAKPLVERLASKALGREVAIDGDLRVDWGWTPTLHVGGLRIANAEWGRQGPMLELGQIDLTVAARPFLDDRAIVVPKIAVRDATVVVERDRNGVGNWSFGDPAAAQDDADDGPASSGGAPAPTPVVEEVDVRNVVVVYDDRKIGRKSELRVDSLTGGEDRAKGRFRLEGDGAYEDRPVRIDIVSGPIARLRADQGEPWPIDGVVRIADFEAAVSGFIEDPKRMQGLDARVDVRGDDAANLGLLTGTSLPTTPRYRLGGELRRDGDRVRFDTFTGKLGNSDLFGDLALDLGGERPRITGRVISNLLDFKDFAGLLGAEKTSKGEVKLATAPGRVLPNKEVDLKTLRAVDADVSVKGSRIVTPKLPIDFVNGRVALEDGVLRLDPATAEIGGGSIELRMMLDGSAAPPRSDLEVAVREINLRRLLAEASSGAAGELVNKTVGVLNGRVKLASVGASVAQIAGAANGEISLVLSDGVFNSLLIELIGLDIAESLSKLVFGDEPVPIRCIVADLEAKDGVFRPRTLLLDTTDTIVVGDGSINMRDERLDLRIRPYPKDFSPLTLRTPISVEGTLAKPQAFPDPAGTGVESTLQKLVAGALTVVTGLLPPVDLGPGRDASCAQLIQRARGGVDRR